MSRKQPDGQTKRETTRPKWTNKLGVAVGLYLLGHIPLVVVYYAADSGGAIRTVETLGKLWTLVFFVVFSWIFIEGVSRINPLGLRVLAAVGRLIAAAVVAYGITTIIGAIASALS